MQRDAAGNRHGSQLQPSTRRNGASQVATRHGPHGPLRRGCWASPGLGLRLGPAGCRTSSTSGTGHLLADLLASACVQARPADRAPTFWGAACRLMHAACRLMHAACCLMHATLHVV